MAQLCMEQATCAAAAAAGHLAAIQWLWSRRLPLEWQSSACDCGWGHLDLLQWASIISSLACRHQLVHVCLDVKLHAAIYPCSSMQDKMAVAALCITQTYAMWQPTTITCMRHTGHSSMAALHPASVYRVSPFHMIGWTVSDLEQQQA